MKAVRRQDFNNWCRSIFGEFHWTHSPAVSLFTRRQEPTGCSIVWGLTRWMMVASRLKELSATISSVSEFQNLILNRKTMATFSTTHLGNTHAEIVPISSKLFGRRGVVFPCCHKDGFPTSRTLVDLSASEFRCPWFRLGHHSAHLGSSGDKIRNTSFLDLHCSGDHGSIVGGVGGHGFHGEQDLRTSVAARFQEHGRNDGALCQRSEKVGQNRPKR